MLISAINCSHLSPACLGRIDTTSPNHSLSALQIVRPMASQSPPDITQQQLSAGVSSPCQATPDRTGSSMSSQNSLFPNHVLFPTNGQEAGQSYQKRVWSVLVSPTKILLSTPPALLSPYISETHPVTCILVTAWSVWHKFRRSVTPASKDQLKPMLACDVLVHHCTTVAHLQFASIYWKKKIFWGLNFSSLEKLLKCPTTNNFVPIFFFYFSYRHIL